MRKNIKQSKTKKMVKREGARLLRRHSRVAFVLLVPKSEATDFCESKGVLCIRTGNDSNSSQRTITNNKIALNVNNDWAESVVKFNRKNID